MAENLIYDPLLNPVKLFDIDLVNDDSFFTKHFDDYRFEDRLLDWERPADFAQIWQTTDIIRLQFESQFDPIIIELLDAADGAVISLPALVGLPNIYYPNTFSYEVAMSLAGLPTGCYRIRRTRGSGINTKTDYSRLMYISETPFTFPNFRIEYWHNRFHEGVIFETGIKFQYRVAGHLGRLRPGKNVEAYKDQKANPTILSSRSFRGFPAYFGDEYGLPDDEIDLLNRIWGCNNVLLDNKSFAAVGNSLEVAEIDDGRYPKRGVLLQIEEGLNRDSKIFSQTVDTNKKLQYGIMVETKVFGDTSNQGSANTVPILTVE